MDPIEEQEQELEVLESIYPQELKRISKNEFSIILLLETESERKHRIKLTVKYPPTYPEVLPDLSVRFPETEELEELEEDKDYEEEGEESEEESENDDEEGKAPIIFSEVIDLSKEDLKILQDKLYDEANENLGMPMIFTLVSLLKEESEELFKNKVELAQKKHDDELLAKEREEMKKFQGTKVTKESFNQWRLKFRKEMGWDKREEERLKKLHGNKMTGKEMFEKGLGGSEEGYDEVEDLGKKLEETAI